MTVVDILYTIFIGPLQLVFEVIYTLANRVINHPGLAIVVLSLVMNFLVLPLYKRSDAMQEEARDTDAKLSKGVEHIKKTFAGDERMMILQTYYRQNNYKPTDALNGSVSLLLQVPFFMAAYNFLSNLQEIQGVSLGPIADLGAPDAMFTIGGFDVNMMPIIMTLVNIISSAIYLKGFPLKQKLQIYGMALFFLVFLYTSPAGLVFYWTMNNVFSLVKTIVYKIKKSESIVKKKDVKVVKNNKLIFLYGGLFLTILVGALIPSALLAASPQEFIDVTFFHNPNWYIGYALCLAIGTFLIWFGVFYWIASPKGKAIMDKFILVLCSVMLVNYMFFGTDLGIISSSLIYEEGVHFQGTQILQNLLVLIVVAAVVILVSLKWEKVLPTVLLTGVIALAGMSGLNIMGMQDAILQAELQSEDVMDSSPHFNLSNTGKNVVVIMLDRALGEYIPFIMNEKPELKEQFAGFTYYNNVISYGACTNFGAPPLYGGYEYTPVEMNKRENESLLSKHNEALKVMPVLFLENDYDVTVCDSAYANYQWIPDMSIYDEYPDISTYITEGAFGEVEPKEFQVQTNRRNFFCFSIMKTMPLFAQEIIYQNGNYNQAAVKTEALVYANQEVISLTEADGVYGSFMNSYNVLENMPYITNVVEEDENTFLMLTNNTTHHVTMLQQPDYTPAAHVDNTEYSYDADAYTVDGMTLKFEAEDQIIHYHVNMAAMLQLGKWFDYLRENDVYNNTKIILVSDHARGEYQLDELTYGDGFADTGVYFPLLMVKDFESEEFTTSSEFMTHADVPVLAFDGLIENPINPFTGKLIDNTEKTAHKQYITNSRDWDVNTNNGNVFTQSDWFAVSDNIWDMSNWEYIEEECTRPDELP